MKRRICLFILFLVSALYMHAQNTVNSDGTIKFRANVAVMVTGNSYTFEKGEFKKRVDDETLSTLKTTIHALVLKKFQDGGFGIVNRNDEASQKVQSLIEENKLEDYLDGFSVQAKGQGADHLYLVDVTIYGESDDNVQIYLSTRLMNVQSNFGYHYSYKSGVISLKDEEDMRQKAKDVVHNFSEALDQQLADVFPEQFFIAKADGKTLHLGAYSTNGLVLTTDKFYAFKFSKEKVSIGGVQDNIQRLDYLTSADVIGMNGGYLDVKAEKAISPSSDIVLFKNNQSPKLPATMTFTYFGLPYNSESYDGLLMKRVNNAVYEAITRHPGAQLIEQDHLAELKQERQLQKTEDFIDGHVVEQMKAIGAAYMIHLDDFARNGKQVSFKFSLVSVEQNMILRTVNVVSSIDNLENELYKQLCERLAQPCLATTNKKDLEMACNWAFPKGTECLLQATKAIQNPATGQISYTIADICKLKVTEYKGNYSTMQVKKIMSQEDYNAIGQYSQVGLLTIMVDGSNISSDFSTESQVDKQEKKKNKTGKGFFGGLKDTFNDVKDKVKVSLYK